MIRFMKQKILVLISNELIIRNYINTNAFNLLKNQFKCKFLINSILIKSFKYKKKILIYKENDANSINLSKIIMRIIYKQKNNNSSYRFISDTYKSKIKLYFRNESFIRNIFLLPKRILALIFRYFYFYFQQSFFFKIKDNYFLETFKVNKDIINTIEELNPKLIIFPFQSMEDEAIYSVMKISKEKKSKHLD